MSVIVKRKVVKEMGPAVNIKIEAEAHATLQALSKFSGESMSVLATTAVEDFIADQLTKNKDFAGYLLDIQQAHQSVFVSPVAGGKKNPKEQPKPATEAEELSA